MYKKMINKVFQGVIALSGNEEEKEEVIYGLEVLISTTVNVLMLLLVGCISNNIVPTIIFMICYCSIRGQAGGSHANSYLACHLFMLLTFCFIIVINPYVIIQYNSVLIILAAISYVIILLLGPILNGKRTFFMDEIKGIKKKIRFILIVEVLMTIVLYLINYELYKFAIYAIITEGVYVIMGKIKYWNLNKNAILKNIMSLSLVVAVVSSTAPCVFFLHETELPKSLKDKLENK